VTSQPPSTQPGTSPAQIELEEPASALAPLYHLILLDDDDHSYQYVIEMLGKIFGYGREKAFALAAIVDNAGQVVLETAGHDQVSDHQGEVHAYGADPAIPQCKGSMSAIIEEADGPTAG
jgi:ATP-dependent Clp protease adaptor protein ClpS